MLKQVAKLLRDGKITVTQFAIVNYIIAETNWGTQLEPRLVNGIKIDLQQRQSAVTARTIAKVMQTSPTSITRALGTLKRVGLLQSKGILRGKKGFTLVELNKDIFSALLRNGSNTRPLHKELDVTDCIDEIYNSEYY